MQIKVNCYCGYRGEETPKSILMGAKKIEIIKILDRWLSPDHRYFKVIGDDSATYIIRHDQQKWQWELTFFNEINGYSLMDKKEYNDKRLL